MELAAVPAPVPPSVAFRDGLGERRHTVDPTGREPLELLCLRGEIATVASFEFALRERVSHLAQFRHAYYGRVRGVERLNDRDATLAIVSDHTPGIRLAEILTHCEERRLPLDINTALCLIRQLVPAIAMLHESAREVGHGAIGPERLIVTPHARLTIVEYVAGAALEQLRFSRERYWNELRIALPRTAGLSRFDQRADVAQIGTVALSLLLGRLLRDDEYPARVSELVASTWAVSARGGFEPLPPGLRAWLGRALQLDARNAFASAVEARDELDRVLGDSEYIASPASLEQFLARYHTEPAAPAKTSPAPLDAPRSIVGPPAAPPSSPLSPASAITEVSRSGFIDAPARLTSVPTETSQKPTPPVVDAPARLTPAVATPARTAPAFIDSSVKPAPAFGDAAVRTAPVFADTPARLASAFPDTPAKLADTPAKFAPAPPVVKPVRVTHGLSSDEPRAELGVTTQGWRKRAAVAAVFIVLASGGFAARRYFVKTPAAITTGTLVVTTNPAGATLMIDGEPRGLTPLTLTLPAGSHVVEVRGEGDPRSIPVTISAGTEVAQFIDLPSVRSTDGELQVRTAPPGAQVTVDGVPRGTSPMTVRALSPGEHAVVLTSAGGSVRHTVTVEQGGTASLVVTLSSPESAPLSSGWISVSAPVDVQLFEHDRLLGTSATDQIMVSAGRHDIDIVNEGLGYRATRTVQVPAGKTASLKLDLPNGTLALNAVPWAEVWIDGERVGETPIGNLSLTIGPHDVVFRHPDLGERHQTATITLKGPERLSVDLRKP